RMFGYCKAAARLSMWPCHWNDSISRNLMQHTIRVCKPSGRFPLTVFKYPRRVSLTIRISSHDLARQLQKPKDPQGRRQDLCLLQPARRGEKRSQGNLETSLFHEGAAGKPAAQ